MNQKLYGFDTVIVGAGAAGLMCAIEAGRRGRRVAVVEHAERIGKKILISGGGRCNFTNIHCKAENFISGNPHFAKSALARFTPRDFIALVEKHGIAYHEKTLGQLFCDGSASEIVKMLETECRDAGVEIFLNARVDGIERGEKFLVKTAVGGFECAALVIATGGLSIPKMGATGFGYDVAKQFGVAVTECRAGLVPLVFGEGDLRGYEDLSGLSADVIARAGKKRFREKMLITHRGLSGPVVLQISSYWKPGETVEIDLAPGRDVFASMLARPDARTEQRMVYALREVLPARLAERWLTLNPPESWSNASIGAVEKAVHTWTVKPVGTEGYAKAEVTVGGVDTDALDAKTMECRAVPGLYFIGEVVDVTGWLGGFNFQWAWASGAAAGRAV